MDLLTKTGLLVAGLMAPGVAALIWMGAPWYGGVLLCVAGLSGFLAVRHALAPLAEVTRLLEEIGAGKLVHDTFECNRNDEVGRLAKATSQIVTQMRGFQKQADVLAAGRFGMDEVEARVLRAGRLSAGDVQASPGASEVERSLVLVTNRLRRLTIQSRIMARDELKNRLLDETIPGDLGESFGVMIENYRQISERAGQIADGDLSSNVEGDGELNKAFNQMVEGLRVLVRQIIEMALDISSSSEEILFVLRDQELAASHQASGVEETQRTMETLLSSARKIAESTQTVFRSAEKTQESNRIVGDRIGDLKAHTGRISEILEVIKSIADRSDLLALNASLEGTRAGEAGKGFTLVAAEMRRLAENVNASVNDIKALVSDIRESSLASVMATEDGSRLSERTTESALKISLITQQQQSGTEQVTQSMDELSHLINQGVAGTQQVTIAASELARLSQDLEQMVQKFRLPTDDLKPTVRTAVSTRKQEVRRMSSVSSDYAGARADLSAEFMAIGAVPVFGGGNEFGSRPSSSGNGSSISTLSARKMHETPVGLQQELGDGPPTVEFSASMDAEMLKSLGKPTSKSSSKSGAVKSETSARSKEDAFDAIARQLEEDDAQVDSSEKK